MIDVFDEGKPVGSTDEKESKRLEGRIKIIDEVLKDMGYKEGYNKYQEYLSQMVQEDFDRYMTFLNRVDEMAKKQGV